MGWTLLIILLLTDFCALKKLEELNLADNDLEGILPSCLSNLTSLRILDLSINQSKGSLSSSMIDGLTALGYIDLSYNHFGGLFSFSSFANHSKLKVIRLQGESYLDGDCNFVIENSKIEIENENPSWVPLFQLKVLVLSNNCLNKFAGNIPEFLFYQRELEFLDISHNRLHGSFPIWLLENNTSLQLLHLQNNYFEGQFHLPPYQYKNLSGLDISNNLLQGKLQENIGKMIPQLKFLNLSHNHIEGNLPSSVSDLGNLNKLDLSYNNFSREVPKKLVGNCSSLNVLKLSNNNFHGEIFSKHFRIFNASLGVLELNDNHFTSTLSF